MIAMVGTTTTQLAHATNESSYKCGYKEGQVEWVKCTYRMMTIAGPLLKVVSHQYPLVWVLVHVHYHDIEHYDIMTNKTACIDGFIHAWNHMCDPVKAKHNGVDCPTTFQNQTG